MIEWKKIKISDLGKVITGNTPPRKNPELYGEHTIFIKPTDVSEGEKYTYNPEECYSELGFNKYKNSLIPKGSTCVVTIGSIGKKMTKAHCDCFINQAMNAVIPNKYYDEEFVFYVLKYNLVQLKTLDSGTASGRENVSKSSFSNINLLVPAEKKIQHKIGSILSAYDDLIENNLKRIKLMEETLQIILNKLSKETDSNPSLIYPEIADFEKGFEPGSNNYVEENSNRLIPFIRVGDLSSRESKLYISSELKGIKMTQSDDILISMDGSIGIVSVGINGAYSSGIRKVVLKNELLKGLIYAFLKSSTGQSQIMTFAKGSTILHASSCIPKLKVFLPNEKKFKNELELSNSCLDQIIKLINQNKKLKESRDILLPKLMNGTINV